MVTIRRAHRRLRTAGTYKVDVPGKEKTYLLIYIFLSRGLKVNCDKWIKFTVTDFVSPRLRIMPESVALVSLKFMSAHILTDNCEKVFSRRYTVIATARLPQNNVRLHTLSVWLGDLWDPCPPAVSPAQTESLLHHSAVDPHSSGPTPLIRSASFSYRMQMHVSAPSPPNTTPTSTMSGALSIHCTSSCSSFLLTNLNPLAVGKKKKKRAGSIVLDGEPKRIE